MNLADYELSAEIAAEIEQVVAASGESPATDRWQQLCKSLAPFDLSPTVYLAIWEHVFEQWDVESNGPAPMWVPDPMQAQDANLSGWMKATDSEEYESFHRWTRENRGEFWRQAIEKIGIQFQTPPTKILDSSAGVDRAKWLTDSRLNLADSCFLADANAIAIIEGQPEGTQQRITYAELNDQVNQVAASIRAAGFQPGDPIGVLMPMTALSVVIYLGMVRAGNPVVSIADSFAPPEIESRLQIAKAKAIFTYDYQIRSGRKLPLFSSLVAASDIPAIVLPFDNANADTNNEGSRLDCELRPQDIAWDDFLVDPTDRFQPHFAGPDQIVNILFSSGTTGEPKAIPWTQTTPIKCAVDGFCHHDLKPGDVVCWPTNLGWMMGPWLIFATLLNRGTIALYNDSPMSVKFGEFVQAAAVNMLGVVPTIVKAWRKRRVMEKFDWSSIKVFSSTGESSQADDMFYLSSLAQMRPVIEYCGGTEIGGGYATSTVIQPNVPAAFSTIAVGLEIEILDENDQPSESGELFIVPPSIGLSSQLLNRDHHKTYFSETPSTPANPILRRHGDHMTRLPSGYFQAGGRVDDTMNLGGIKISSAKLERVMNQIEHVKETAAVAVSLEGGPNSLVVFVVIESDAVTEKSVTEKSLKMEINKRIRSELNPLFKAKSVHLVDALPRTTSGKVMRRKLRASIESDAR